MAWDFSTEPAFEEKLNWMRAFVRDEIIPLETLDLDPETLAEATEPLKAEVKRRGLWAAHLPPELGGGGFGQVKLGLMNEILGTCSYARACSATTPPIPGMLNSLRSAGRRSRSRSGCTRCSAERCAVRSR